MQAAAPQDDGSAAVVTPASGAPGMTVTGSGTDWTPGDDIQAEWGDDYSDLGCPVVVASDGTFTDSFAIPSDATTGSHQVLFWDQEAQYFEVANFDVTSSPPPPPSSCNPSVSLTPDSGQVGSQFVLAGTGWAGGGTVNVTLPDGSKGIFYASTWTPTVGTDGTWQITATVGNSPVGSYTFTFAESGCASQTGSFTVTAPPASCNPSVSLTPDSGAVGSQFVMAGTGWASGGTVEVTPPDGANGAFRITDPSPAAGAGGGWQTQATVGYPAPGSYTFTFTESGCPSQTGTFTVTAPTNTVQVFRNPYWNGYVVDTNGPKPPADLTETTATWKVPAISCTFEDAVAGAAAGYWVGLGGVAHESLAQTGIETDCDLNVHFHPNQVNYIWWEIANNIRKQPVTSPAYPVKVGDTITATVDYTGGGTAPDYTFTVQDRTQGWSWSTSCPGNSACPTSGVSAGYPQSAETVIEPNFNGLGTQAPLADFGTVTFTNVRYKALKGSGYRVLAFEAPQTGNPEADVASSLLNPAVTYKNDGLRRVHKK